jgi:hypothetical protein
MTPSLFSGLFKWPQKRRYTTQSQLTIHREGSDVWSNWAYENIGLVKYSLVNKLFMAWLIVKKLEFIKPVSLQIRFQPIFSTFNFFCGALFVSNLLSSSQPTVFFCGEFCLPTCFVVVRVRADVFCTDSHLVFEILALISSLSATFFVSILRDWVWSNIFLQMTTNVRVYPTFLCEVCGTSTRFHHLDAKVRTRSDE